MLFVCELFFIEGRGHSRRMMVMGKGVLEHERWSGPCRFQLRLKGAPICSLRTTVDSSVPRRTVL